MNIISSIINFLKSLFNSKTTSSDKAITQTTDRNKKYALIVGMETSAKFGSCPGADKDSNTMNALIGQYMDSTHIQRLNNASATRAAVVSALNEQIAKVPADGLFVFTYSGHGGQNSWSSSAKNEIDGKDEFLCLNDGGLLDDDLWTIFNRCKGRIFVVFDCCHSGTMYRLANGE